MTLYEETVKILKENGKKVSDIRWVGVIEKAFFKRNAYENSGSFPD